MRTENPNLCDWEETKAEEHEREGISRVQDAGGLFQRSCQFGAQDRAPGPS